MEAGHSVHRILSQLMPDKRGNRKVTTTKTSAKTKSITFPMVRERRSRASSSLTGAGTERRAGAGRDGAQPEPGAERRGDAWAQKTAPAPAALPPPPGGWGPPQPPHAAP